MKDLSMRLRASVTRVVKTAENVKIRALGKESDASLQVLILLEDCVQVFGGPTSLPEFYQVGFRYLHMSRHVLWIYLDRDLKKGLVMKNQGGNEDATYSLTKLGKKAVAEARRIGIKRREIWAGVLSLREHLQRDHFDG